MLDIHLNMLFQPAYEIWIHIAGALSFSINMHVQLPSVDKGHEGAQWLSGRVLDSRPKGRGFEPHQRHCVVVLEQDIFILA